MGESLSWGEQEAETQGLLGMLIGTIIALSLLVLEHIFFRGMFLGKFYYWFTTLLPFSLPRWFLLVFIGGLGLIIGLCIDLANYYSEKK